MMQIHETLNFWSYVAYSGPDTFVSPDSWEIDWFSPMSRYLNGIQSDLFQCLGFTSMIDFLSSRNLLYKNKSVLLDLFGRGIFSDWELSDYVRDIISVSLDPKSHAQNVYKYIAENPVSSIYCNPIFGWENAKGSNWRLLDGDIFDHNLILKLKAYLEDSNIYKFDYINVRPMGAFPFSQNRDFVNELELKNYEQIFAAYLHIILELLAFGAIATIQIPNLYATPSLFQDFLCSIDPSRLWVRNPRKYKIVTNLGDASRSRILPMVGIRKIK